MNEQDYDQVTDVATEDYAVATEDYWLRFRVPPGLMPDSQFDDRPARLQVHRVRPVYENGKGPSERRAVVLIRGRTVPGPVVFDLRDPSGVTAPGGGALNLSVQKALARVGIDTFAPSLLGYGRSTRFSLNDPGNASLSQCRPAGSGPRPLEGCDSTSIAPINPLEQQKSLLIPNPLAESRAHSSNFHFARTDLWVRDIDQLIEDAIERARPTDGKVALVGYSVGGQHVGRTLYAGNPLGGELLEERDKMIAKVSRVAFLNSLFGGLTEERDPFGPPTFPLTLNDQKNNPPENASDDLWRMPTTQPPTQPCNGQYIEGTKEQVWAQTMEHETVGREWGPTGGQPNGGLNRAPTFSGYGWNPTVAGKLSKPTLVMQGLKDGVLPNVPGSTVQAGPKTGEAIYNNLYKDLPQASMPKKVLVQIECASHALPWEGAHAALKDALIEWIKSGRYKGNESGSFLVKESGQVVQQ